MTETIFDSVTARIGGLDWDELQRQLDNRGFALTAPVFSGEECVELAGLFESDRFRSTIDMARHRFGDGRYRYFAHPLPDAVQAARVAFYERLVPLAILQVHTSARLNVLGYAPCFIAGVLAWKLSMSAKRRLPGWLWPFAFMATWPLFFAASQSQCFTGSSIR